MACFAGGRRKIGETQGAGPRNGVSGYMFWAVFGGRPEGVTWGVSLDRRPRFLGIVSGRNSG